MKQNRKQLNRIGILTGGGDCPGLNAVIRAVAKSAMLGHGAEVIGFEDGYEGVMHNKYRALSYQDVSGILTRGGTILGTSNKASPFDGQITPRTTIVKSKKLSQTLRHIEAHNLDALFCIGGDGSLSIAEGLFRLGVPVIGIPKTIDNDLSGTDVTFGFNSAATVACDAVDRLHSTAMSHHRVMILEVMGRYAGWIALYAGLAGGGDIILMPEIPFSMETICKRVIERNQHGKRYSMVVVAEGAKPKGGVMSVNKVVTGSPDPVRLGGIGLRIADAIENVTHLEARVTTLGHLQRGGTPTSFDRVLATRFGVAAIALAERGMFGTMAALNGDIITHCSLKHAVGKLKRVDPRSPLVKTAQSVGTSFGV
jgi:ATP-dependent phosphofructokinase / diphosphate-dependent phosphofructokinase